MLKLIFEEKYKIYPQYETGFRYHNVTKYISDIVLGGMC